MIHRQTDREGGLSLLRVPPVAEVCLDERLEAPAPPLADVEHEEYQQHQQTDEHPAQGGAQHHHVGPALHCTRPRNPEKPRQYKPLFEGPLSLSHQVCVC